MTNVVQSTIDREQITGAFALAVDVVFNDLFAGTGQDVFEFADAGRTSVLSFGQIGQSADVAFTLVQGGVTYRVVAQDAIVEGEYATWRVGIDPDGVMRISKNFDLLTEGPGVMPIDVQRDYAIGASAATDDTDLNGTVLNLKIANYGDVEQLDPAYQASPCATTGETRCFCDKLLPEGLARPGVEGETVISTTDPEGDGEWSPVQSMGVIAIHSVVLPDGKVFYYGTDENGTQTGQFVYGLYDPETGVDITLPNTTDTDIFCTTLSLDPTTGNILLFGGDARGEGGPKNGAVNDVVVFDYTTRTIRDINDPEMQLIYPNGDEMKYDRWYGSSVTMSNGEILVLGGKGALKGGLLGLFGQTKATEDKVEVFNPQTGWRELTGVKIDVDYWYPKLYAVSDGSVVTFAYGGVYRIDAAGTGTSQEIGRVTFPNRNDSPSVMYDTDKIAIIGDDGYLYTADLSQQTVVFEQRVDVVSGRGDGGMVVLPDGKVMLVGGTDGGQNDLPRAEYRIEIWDPVTNALETIDAGPALARLYHSSYQLLPNGTVFVGGGGAPGPLVNTNAEFYAPSYLYDASGNEAERPVIESAPTNLNGGDTFTIQVDDTSDIARVTALRTGAFTHAVNFDARFLELDFNVLDGSTLEITSQPDNIMIPGAWMLFVLDDQGVPSKASMLGVSMVDIVDTPPLTFADGELSIYGIDDDQIDGAFEIQVEARFDDLSQAHQRVFDFGNGPQKDNILLTQNGRSDDMSFVLYVAGKKYQIVARDVLVEGEIAKWTVSVDKGGYMRLYKDDVLVAEGQGAVPEDVDRTHLVGQSNWQSDDDLNGMVRNLEIVNEGDLPEYVYLGTPKIGLRALGDVQESDDGQKTKLQFEAFLDQPAPVVIAADIILQSGNVTAPAQLIIGAGQMSGIIEVTAQGNTDLNLDDTVSISLANVTNARVEGELVARAKIFDNDAAGTVDLLGTSKLIGDAFASNGAVVLTPMSGGKKGALGTDRRIDFKDDFLIKAEVYLGDNDSGADGLGIVFHNDPAGSWAIGNDGGSLGIYGIDRGFGFELDTHKGNDDIGEDHFAFFDADSRSRLSDRVALSNLEDGSVHEVDILWDASAQTMSVSLGGTVVGTLSGSDLLARLGSDFGYLTVAAATGGRSNEHRIDSLSFAGTMEPEVPASDTSLLRIDAVSGFAGRQDRGSAAISPDGTSVDLSGNTWKALFTDITITANTVISFDFDALDTGEVSGLLFETDNTITNNRGFQIGGTQDWGRNGAITDFRTYVDGSGVVRYDIKVGDYFTGNFDRLVFVGDDDRNGSTDSTFANIRFYEQAITFGGSRYELGTAGLTWEEARAEAEAKGGKIVEIDSQAENTFVFDTFGGDKNTIWLGLNDTAREGQFVYSDGSAAGYTNWLPGEPNDWGGSQDYAIMASNTGQWDDAGNGGGWFYDGSWSGGFANQLVIEYDLS